MHKIMEHGRAKALRLRTRLKNIISDTSGDQITGWLIVVLLVVVVGAFFLNTYKTTITEVWDAIVARIYDTFGL